MSLSCVHLLFLLEYNCPGGNDSKLYKIIIYDYKKTVYFWENIILRETEKKRENELYDYLTKTIKDIKMNYVK